MYLQINKLIDRIFYPLLIIEVKMLMEGAYHHLIVLMDNPNY